MLIGQSLLCEPGFSYTYFGPWFPRAADAATFACEVMYASGAFTMNINIQHKNSEDPDSAASNLNGPTVVTGVGTILGSYVGFEELVRYVFEITSDEVDPVWIHMRMNPPIWQPN